LYVVSEVTKLRIGIIISSSADLPLSFIQKHDLDILPYNIQFGKTKFIDKRDPDHTMKLYKTFLKERNTHVETKPFTPKQIQDWFLGKLVHKYDEVLILTVMASRSPTYRNASLASIEVSKACQVERAKEGNFDPFAIRVIDTNTLFTGEAVIAYQMLHSLKTKQSTFEELRTELDDVIQHTHAYLVPQDLYYLRNVARKKGDNSVPLSKYMVAKLLNMKPIMCAHKGETFPFDSGRGFKGTLDKLLTHATEQVTKGLKVPMVCMSYAGDPAEFQKRDDYKKFVAHLEQHNVKHTISVMSISAGMNMGPGAFSLGLVVQDNDFLKNK